MRNTFYELNKYCPSLGVTSTSFYPNQLDLTFQKKSHLQSLNYCLLNEITDSQTQKNYYRVKLTQEFHIHQNQLQVAYSKISEKNQFILQLEQQLDRMSKDYRILSDEYIGLKNQLFNLKQLHQTEINLLKRNHQQDIQRIQDEAQIKFQIKINKRTQQIEQQTEKKLCVYKSLHQEAKASSNQLIHQLKLLKQDYCQVMNKNNILIQQSIEREIRKRDFQIQNSALEDCTRLNHLKKVNLDLNSEIKSYLSDIQSLNKQLTRLKAENIVLQTKIGDLEEAFNHEKQNNRVTLDQKYKTTDQMQTNTEQQFVSVIFPVETNLIGQLIALKQFLTEKLILKYQEFFTKASLKQKKKSASLITFKNYLAEELKNSFENGMLLQVHSGLERILKLYCPVKSYSRQFLTVKDEFIRKTLIECQALTNKEQKLFRLLELVHRLRQPINHFKGEISTGELKMLEIKILATLKKIFIAV